MEQQTLVPSTWAGMTVGLFLGYVAVQFGISRAIAVAICGLVGYWIMAFRRGDFDLIDQVSRLQIRDRTFR